MNLPLTRMTSAVGAARLCVIHGALADNDPDSRFKGAPTYDLAVTNVKWETATPEYSYVTFDLSWGHSWRAKWVEPAKTSVTGKDMEVESWDAVWVFVKFLPEKDAKESIERNHWQHAALDPDPAHHVMPAGATNTVRLFDGPSTGLGAGGNRGVGVFIYRDALGTGPNNGMAAASLKDLVDVGLPTERYARGNHAGGYGSPLTVFRVGCFATPTSDRVAAGASYWGIPELGARVVSVLKRVHGRIMEKAT